MLNKLTKIYGRLIQFHYCSEHVLNLPTSEVSELKYSWDYNDDLLKLDS